MLLPSKLVGAVVFCMTANPSVLTDINATQSFRITMLQALGSWRMAQFQAKKDDDKEEEDERPNLVIISMFQQNAFILSLIEITQCVSHSACDFEHTTDACIQSFI